MPLVITTPFQEGSYERIVATCGGTPFAAFRGIGMEISKRFFSQQSIPPPGDAYLENLWHSIWQVVHKETLPIPLAPNEMGEPCTPDDSYLFALAENSLLNLPRHRADDLLRTLCFQIIAALLSPEFKACRQSYEQKDTMEGCSRQSLEQCIDRVSGSHCEDCPFFVALTQDQHRKLLGRAFSPEKQDIFLDNIGVFLPEDFRALRIFWHLHLRQN